MSDNKRTRSLLLFTCLAVLMAMIGVPELLKRSPKATKAVFEKVEKLSFKAVHVIPLKAGEKYHYDFVTPDIKSLLTAIKNAGKLIGSKSQLTFIDETLIEERKYLEFLLTENDSRNKREQKVYISDDNWLGIFKKKKFTSIIAVDYLLAQSDPQKFISSLQEFGIPKVPLTVKEVLSDNNRVLSLTVNDFKACDSQFFLHCKSISLIVESLRSKKTPKSSATLYEVEVKAPSIEKAKAVGSDDSSSSEEPSSSSEESSSSEQSSSSSSEESSSSSSEEPSSSSEESSSSEQSSSSSSEESSSSSSEEPSSGSEESSSSEQSTSGSSEQSSSSSSNCSAEQEALAAAQGQLEVLLAQLNALQVEAERIREEGRLLAAQPASRANTEALRRNAEESIANSIARINAAEQLEEGARQVEAASKALAECANSL